MTREADDLPADGELAAKASTPTASVRLRLILLGGILTAAAGLAACLMSAPGYDLPLTLGVLAIEGFGALGIVILLRAASLAGRGTARAAAERRPLSFKSGVAIALLLGIPAAFWYAKLLSFGGSGLFAPVDYGRTFNSMLVHLLHGTFDVDPQTIGPEGTVRNHATYTYFGILPALLRAPLLYLKNFSEVDLTRLGCLVAVSLMATFKVLSLLRVWRAAATAYGSPLLVLFMIAILFGSAQVAFLSPSLFQEVDFWADVFAAAFVYLVLCGYFSDKGFSSGLTVALAAIAGLCLQTRVSTALGLYVAFALLWVQLAWRAWREADPEPTRRTGLSALLASALILLISAAAAGFINYERWGNPLAFGDPSHYIINLTQYPDRLAREQKYGLFNFVRFGYGLMYYFFPIWIFHDSSGNLLWGAFQYRTIDSIELPPGSFFVSDPLLLGLTAYALIRLFRHGDMAKPGVVAAMLAGFMVPIVLILIAIDMAYRYRIEFFPFFEFCAFIGFAQLLSRAPERARIPFALAAIWSIIISPISWFLYKISPFAPAAKVLGHTDLISYYLARLHI